MESDIKCLSFVSLPAAATKPEHAVRKAEFDALAAAVAALETRVTALEPVTSLDTPVISVVYKSSTSRQGKIEVTFDNIANATSYSLYIKNEYGGIICSFEDYSSGSEGSIDIENYKRSTAIVYLIAKRYENGVLVVESEPSQGVSIVL
ncbi:MAG: hypothetical protein Q4G68_11360 [Planctomycetia bacterium]|nr:hypothetical protein [Planctomycetia bacterium]